MRDDECIVHAELTEKFCFVTRDDLATAGNAAGALLCLEQGGFLPSFLPPFLPLRPLFPRTGAAAAAWVVAVVVLVAGTFLLVGLLLLLAVWCGWVGLGWGWGEWEG